MEKKPKFSIGQDLSYLTPDLYNQTSGKVMEIERLFSQTYEDGSFKPGGLSWLETDLESLKSKYELNGDILVIYPHFQPGKKETYKFNYYAYTVTNDKMASVYPEHKLYK